MFRGSLFLNKIISKGWSKFGVHIYQQIDSRRNKFGRSIFAMIHHSLYSSLITSLAISTPISHLLLSLFLLISNDEVVEGIVSTAFLHGINSDCSHTRWRTAHYIRMYIGRGKYFMQQTLSHPQRTHKYRLQLCQTNHLKQLLRGLQRPSVVVWDVPRTACPRLDMSPDINLP